MISKIFAVKDVKIGIYHKPFSDPHEQNAVRIFAAAVNDEQTSIFKNPEDYELYKIGEYNDENAKLKPVGPEFITNSISLVKGYENGKDSGKTAAQI